MTTSFSVSSLISAGRDAAIAGVTITQHAMSKVNMPTVLAVAAEKSRELAAERIPQATIRAYQACKANTGTAVACASAGAGLLVVAPAIVAAPSLAVLGFEVNGVVLGALPLPKFRLQHAQQRTQ